MKEILMAKTEMTTCLSCGLPISRTASKCPHCGDDHTPETLQTTADACGGCVGTIVGAIGWATLNTYVFHLSLLGWGFWVGGLFALGGAAGGVAVVRKWMNINQ